MQIITVADVEYLAFRLARKFLSLNEPIPDFSTRVPHRLESCILTPFQTYAGKDLYPGLVAKAAILFYLIIKNHPFQNGNKRIATTTLLTFLFLNEKWLKAETQEFLDFTIWVAESRPRFKEQVVETIQIFIQDHLTDV
jgi:death-on-curing family protein